MKRLLLAFMLATLIGPVFVQAASANISRNAPYTHESSCMYRGYPCSEWQRDDGW
jgi:hypothetical protein